MRRKNSFWGFHPQHSECLFPTIGDLQGLVAHFCLRCCLTYNTSFNITSHLSKCNITRKAFKSGNEQKEYPIRSTRPAGSNKTNLLP